MIVISVVFYFLIAFFFFLWQIGIAGRDPSLSPFKFNSWYEKCLSIGVFGFFSMIWPISWLIILVLGLSGKLDD